MASKVLAQVFNDGFRLSDDDLLATFRRDPNDRAFPKWVDGLQVISSTEVFIALEDLDLVLKIQFFEQPDYSL